MKRSRAAGLPVDPADVARLWPLGHRHLNVHGRDTFMLADPVARGQLRPLRDPADPEEYELTLGDAIG